MALRGVSVSLVDVALMMNKHKSQGNQLKTNTKQKKRTTANKTEESNEKTKHGIRTKTYKSDLNKEIRYYRTCRSVLIPSFWIAMSSLAVTDKLPGHWAHPQVFNDVFSTCSNLPCRTQADPHHPCRH